MDPDEYFAVVAVLAVLDDVFRNYTFYSGANKNTCLVRWAVRSDTTYPPLAGVKDIVGHEGERRRVRVLHLVFVIRRPESGPIGRR
jgi:hypothetical protein